jgi:hypothetical protein
MMISMRFQLHAQLKGVGFVPQFLTIHNFQETGPLALELTRVAFCNLLYFTETAQGLS